MANDKLLVTGASGQLGRAVIAQLLATQTPSSIIAVTRDPKKLADLAERGVEVRAGSFDDAESVLAEAFRGARSVLIISTDKLDEPGARIKQHQNAVAAARRAGAEHIVYTSLTRCEPGSPITFANDHYASEQAVAKSGLAYTVLRNNWYTEMLAHVALEAAKSGKLFSATNGRGVSSITREDCAAAAAAALVRGPHGHEVLELSGPEALTFDALASIAAAKTGKPVEHVQVDHDGFLGGLRAAGIPEPLAAVFASFHDAIADGHLGGVSQDFEKLTGRKPTSVAAYIASH